MNPTETRSAKCRPKIVIFGAGKIGRSLIGLIFSRGGFEVAFIDVCRPLIDELNKRHNYNVIIKDKVEEVIKVSNVRGVYTGDIEKVIEEITTARLAAISVGQSGMKSVIQLIAKGMLERFKSKDAFPLDIIIAENLRDSSKFVKSELRKHLPPEFQLNEKVGLIEASIGKMVPDLQKKEIDADILQIRAEKYNLLILDKRAFKGPIPEIKELALKDNIKAWVDRKLFIHNLGHSTAAYYGYMLHPDAVFIYEVLDDNKVLLFTKAVMLQAAMILCNVYPGEFSFVELEKHIDDLLKRFRNKALHDTIFRVGQDLVRKLGPDDRFVGIIKLGATSGIPYNKILEAMSFAFLFNAKDENGNKHPGDYLFENYKLLGLEYVLRKVCGLDFPGGREVIDCFKQYYYIANNIYRKQLK